MNTCFFRKKSDHVLVITHNGEGDQNRLRRLALSHAFNIFHVGHSLVIVQGQNPDRSGFEDMESEFVRIGNGQWQLAGGENQARDVCGGCVQRDDCWRRYNGLDGTVPSVYPVNHDRRPSWQRNHDKDAHTEASEDLERAIHDGHRAACALITPGHAEALTITAADLQALGWHVATRPQHMNPETEGDDRIVASMIDEGVDFEDLAAVAKSRPYFAAQALQTGFPDRVKAGTLDFSYETHVAHRLVARFKSVKSGATNKARRAYRKSECAGCVYACKEVWRLETPCRLSPDMVPTIGGWQGTEAQKSWLGAWGRWGGRKGKRDRKNFIVYGPTRSWLKGEQKLSLRSLTPGYREFAQVSEDELGQIGVLPRSFDVDALPVEHLPSLFLVMRAMDRSYFHGDLRYYGDGKSKRNDVLAMEIDRWAGITVRTDTAAGHYGGFGYKGSSITISGRPRFHVDLSPPYFRSLHEQLGIRPGIGGHHVQGRE